MFTRTEECYTQISRYKRMAGLTNHPEIKAKCEQQLERWKRRAVKWERAVASDRAVA
jgi:hypothetical protein